jgi:hypothetical protein
MYVLLHRQRKVTRPLLKSAVQQLRPGSQQVRQSLTAVDIVYEQRTYIVSEESVDIRHACECYRKEGSEGAGRPQQTNMDRLGWGSGRN